MTATVSPSLPTPARTARKRRTLSPRRSERSSSKAARSPLGRYVDAAGHRHEIVSRHGCAGSVLIIDRNLAVPSERRLVAHLSADEPARNAGIICQQYLGDLTGRWCRSLTVEDLRHIPLTEDQRDGVLADADGEILDEHGRSYRLRSVSARMSIPEVRWVQHPADGQYGPVRVLSVREVIATLQAYEPVREMTSATIERYGQDREISVSVLRGEIERLSVSRIVLNRGLREAVQGVIQASGVSLSEIAMRCGRTKRDARGNRSGEASWLCRRLGLVPESGGTSCTPWIHSDVLALIARRGLGISPREVELG